MQEYAKLISVDVVKQALGLTTSDKDTVLDRYIGWCSNAIQREAGQPIAQADVVVEMYGCNLPDTEFPYGPSALSYYPVTGLVKVETRSHEFGAAWSTATLSDYEIRGYKGLYYLFGRNGLLSSGYRITVTVGYTEVPGEIQRVAMEMVIELVKQSDIAGIGKNRFGLSSVAESDSKTGITKTTTLLSKRPDWRETIAHYAVGVTV